MTVFVVLAALLVVAVAGLLLPALLRQPKAAAGATAAGRREANLAIFRDQQAELERERDEGLLSGEDFEQARRELQRRLLEEVRPDDATQPPSGAKAGRKTALALLLIVPIAAATGYAILGNPRALDPLQTQPQQRVSPEQIQGMVGKLVERLKNQPDDAEGWVMLARSYKVLGRHADAADAYAKGGALVNKDASLLADYAEVSALAAGNDFRGKPTELLAQALKLDANEPQALLLSGAAAADRGDFSAAAAHWEGLLAQLEPGSDEAQSVQAAIDQARKAADRKSGKGGKAAAEAIGGSVTLSPKLAAQAKPDDTVFVFARAEDGSKMPIVALRVTVKDLPLRFRFDDSMALKSGQKLSDFPAVRVEARIARSGQTQSGSGDLYGVLHRVKPGSEGLNLTIDQVVP